MRRRCRRGAGRSSAGRPRRCRRSEEQPPARGGGVDALAQRPKPDMAGLQVVGDLLEVAHRPPKPVQLGDHQGVAGPQVGQRLVEGDPARQGPGGMVGEGLLTAGGRQRVGLRLRMLVLGRDPSVPDESYPRTVTRTCLALRRSRVARRCCHCSAVFARPSRRRSITRRPRQANRGRQPPASAEPQIGRRGPSWVVTRNPRPRPSRSRPSITHQQAYPVGITSRRRTGRRWCSRGWC